LLYLHLYIYLETGVFIYLIHPAALCSRGQHSPWHKLLPNMYHGLKSIGVWGWQPCNIHVPTVYKFWGALRSCPAQCRDYFKCIWCRVNIRNLFVIQLFFPGILLLSPSWVKIISPDLWLEHHNPCSFRNTGMMNQMPDPHTTTRKIIILHIQLQVLIWRRKIKDNGPNGRKNSYLHLLYNFSVIEFLFVDIISNF
jgi:hypothetical protein